MNWLPSSAHKAILRGWRVLVVEDSFLVSQELAEMFDREGAEIVGPASDVDDACRLAREAPRIDAAVLDVSIRGRMVWPVADILAQRDVKMIFATGYPAASIRERYGRVQVAAKPVAPRFIARILATEFVEASGRARHGS